MGSGSAVPLLTACPYSSIFSFGDSLADTGNLYFSSHQSSSFHCFIPPYGQTYFHQPSARCSDGRLIIDFIAESLGLPLVKPYLGIKNGELEDGSVEEGVNFAVIGATALDVSFFEEEKGIHDLPTNYSLRVQLNWFKEFLPTLCNSSTSCQKVLGNSLFLVGEIGGNDFNYPLFLRNSIAEVKTYVPYVINAITSAINELIDLGARTLMVPGNLPLDAELQLELLRLRELHPHAISSMLIITMLHAILSQSHKIWFRGLKICCGMGGRYNYNASAPCGNPGVVACDDPSQYSGWMVFI
ncbi:SGNH hydrolase superfamily [Sesbania bispinosa]|nr:SGNH hydrolase superfamily [Sesbania bispinosa]